MVLDGQLFGFVVLVSMRAYFFVEKEKTDLSCSIVVSALKKMKMNDFLPLKQFLVLV